MEGLKGGKMGVLMTGWLSDWLDVWAAARLVCCISGSLGHWFAMCLVGWTAGSLHVWVAAPLVGCTSG